MATERLLAPVFEAVGWEEMTGHEFLTEDRLVQKSVFAGGASVIVNFGKEAVKVEGREVAGESFVIMGRDGRDGQDGRNGRSN